MRRSTHNTSAELRPTFQGLILALSPLIGPAALIVGLFDGFRSISERLSAHRSLLYCAGITLAFVATKWCVRRYGVSWRLKSGREIRISALGSAFSRALVGLLVVASAPFWFPLLAGPPPITEQWRGETPEAKLARQRFEYELQAGRAENEIRVTNLLNEAHDILGGEEGAALIRDRWEITPQELTKAHRKINEALVLDPENIQALHLKSVALSQGGDDAEAAEVARRAMRGRHGSNTHHHLAVAYSRLGRHDEAVEQFEEALRNPKCCVPSTRANFAWTLIQRGDAKRGDAQRAEEQARKAIAEDPTIFWAYDSLAHALHHQGRDDEALEVLQRNMDLHPKWVMSHSNAASFLTEAGRYKEAITLARRAIKIDPRYPRAYVILGIALAVSGDDAACLQAAKDAVRANLKDARSHAFLGKALAQSSQYRSAAASFQQAADLDPKNREYYQWYAQHAAEHAEGKHTSKEDWIQLEGKHAHGQIGR